MRGDISCWGREGGTITTKARISKRDQATRAQQHGKSVLIAEYKLVCKNIANLKRIYIKYFNNFAYSKKLNIKILGKNKKTAYVASKSKKIIKLKDFFNW